MHEPKKIKKATFNPVVVGKRVAKYLLPKSMRALEKTLKATGKLEEFINQTNSGIQPHSMNLDQYRNSALGT